MKLFPSKSETMSGWSAAVRAGKRSCEQALEACLQRIDELEPLVHAWLRIDRDQARTTAAQLDAELRSGTWRGPLHGMPMGIKDLFDVASWPTTAGAPRLAQRVAREDAPVVARLRQAGANIMGKTITTRFASFDPPETRNPWNPACTPGGSSSGSAAALATGMCLGAMGSQTGGSITRPASYCGVAGLKPTYGRVSCQGVFPLAPSMDHPGPMARTVGDLAILWDVVADPAPSQIAPAPSSDTIRIGRLRGFFEDNATLVMRSAFDKTIAALAQSGCRISDAALPSSFDDVIRQHRIIMATESAAYHESSLKQHPDDYLPKIRALLEEGLATPATSYIRAREHQEQLKRDILGSFEGFNVLVAPATPGPAPERSTTGDPIFNSPWSYTGLPVVSFPIALSPEGLPLAIQLIGPPHSESALLAVAERCERAVQNEKASV